MNIREFEEFVFNNPEVATLHGRYDLDTVNEWLPSVQSSPLDQLNVTLDKFQMSHRTLIRHFAAIFFDQPVNTAAYSVQRVINNREYCIHDYIDILSGEKDEIPFATLQDIARRITIGESDAAIVRAVGTSAKTVRQIDRVTGLRLARRDRLIGKAINQLADQEKSAQVFARRNGLTRTEAENIMREAKRVVEETR